MTLYFFLLITVIRVFVPITCDAFVALKIYSTLVNWFFSPVVVLVVQSCPALCNPMDCSPPGSSVHEFSRQEYWSGLPFPSPRDLPDTGTKARSSAQQADSFKLQLASLKQTNEPTNKKMTTNSAF